VTELVAAACTPRRQNTSDKNDHLGGKLETGEKRKVLDVTTDFQEAMNLKRRCGMERVEMSFAQSVKRTDKRPEKKSNKKSTLEALWQVTKLGPFFKSNWLP